MKNISSFRDYLANIIMCMGKDLLLPVWAGPFIILINVGTDQTFIFSINFDRPQSKTWVPLPSYSINFMFL